MRSDVRDAADHPDPRHVALVTAAARAARPRAGDVVVIAIDGRSGAGKTSLAGDVGQELDCPVVHMDRLYPGWDGLAASVGLLTDQVLEPLARGEPARYRVWNWATSSWGGQVVLPDSRFLVIEGCGASVGEAGRYAAVRVWMVAGRAERRARGLARDGESYRRHWQCWANQEDALFGADATAERADVLIDTSPPVRRRADEDLGRGR